MSVVSKDVRADASKPRPTETFRPDIQGLRAIAVLAVVLNHAGIPFVSGGYVGVDVFFVISGFLISSHLLRSLDTDGGIHFGQFYARRARRILPSSFVVLAASILGAFLFVPPLLREQVFRDAIATALYVPNYAFAVQGTDYLSGTSPSVFQHYWSLGVEEQFYLAWPLLLLATFLIGRRSRLAMVAVLGIVVAVSLMSCIVLTWVSQPWAFFSLWTRAWELGIGGLIAALPLRRQLPPVLSAVLGWLGLVGIVLTCVLYSSRTAFPGFAAAVPVVCAALVIFAGSSPSSFGPVALLRLRPLQFLGLISYSLYLVHWPVLILTQAAVGTYNTIDVWGMTALVAASVPMAWLLYRFVENPARRSRWFACTKRRALFAALGGSLVLMLVAVGGGAATAAMPLNSGRTTAASAPADPPIATSFVPANLTPTLHHATKDNPSVYADGCEVDFADTAPHPCYSGDPNANRIVLFGDSHAAQWYPALEKIASAHDYRIETETKSACPSVTVEISNKGLDYAACDAWRNNVIANLTANPPALVVISNYGNPVFENPSDLSGQWAAGMRSTLGQLTRETKVAVIADTPDFRVSPIICLSANLSSAAACARPADVVLDSPGRIPGASAANLKGATFVDLTGYFCSTTCPAIIGATTVYRDSHHLTATFAASMAAALWKRLRPILSSTSP